MLTSGEFEIEQDKFYRYKSPTFLEDEDEVKNVLECKKIS